ncbi:MAG: lipoate--protein ligase [Spirochaetaceae bacterium]|nr:MAG: lipoate--protein ligase [Spirochaetaceae bacterium]
MRVHRIRTTNPYTNLAIESMLLDGVVEPTLLIWRNDPCVVIGRHQNPWVECDLDRMHADGIPLSRRISGGGAVYHDAGNTNFSFIAPSDRYDQERHFGVVIAALAALGVEAIKTERNDLRVGDRKISGNAFRHTRGRSLHHGTLLVDADLDRLVAYLAAPASGSIATKATPSVRSVVTNLADHAPGLTHDRLADALESAFISEYGGAGEPSPRSSGAASLGTLASPAAAADVADELASWEWVYGHTPRFQVTVPVAGVGSVVLTVVHGVVDSVECASAPQLALRLRDRVRSLRYDSRTVQSRIAEAL